MPAWNTLSHSHGGVREVDMQMYRSEEGTGLKDWHWRIGDIELVHKDVARTRSSRGRGCRMRRDEEQL